MNNEESVQLPCDLTVDEDSSELGKAKSRIKYLEDANTFLKDANEHLVFEREVLKSQLQQATNPNNERASTYERLTIENLEAQVRFFRDKAVMVQDHFKLTD
jgi:hypothetical protein